jgi:ABC-type multidrug transport system fused ATPase/permease subunit
VTQARVAGEIEGMNMTCIVAAHRLSTVINADRICVFDQAGLVQQGTYAELAAQPGLFASLIQRQTV